VRASRISDSKLLRDNNIGKNNEAYRSSEQSKSETEKKPITYTGNDSFEDYSVC